MAVQKIRTSQIQAATITKDLINPNVAGTGVSQDLDGSLKVKVASNSGVFVDSTGIYIDYYKDNPTGAVDGTNAVYTLSFTPVANSEMIFTNGILQEAGAGNDYTISSKTVTFANPPYSGDKIRAAYLVASRT
jgi:hypothetical protein